MVTCNFSMLTQCTEADVTRDRFVRGLLLFIVLFVCQNRVSMRYIF